jgi:hypothetical protein
VQRILRGIALSILVLSVMPGALPARAMHAPAYSRAARPVLAFYYTWYHPGTFCRCTMSDLPVRPYESSDPATIDRQIAEASNAGITGFITSWPGPGNTQDANLALLLKRAALYQKRTGRRFVSSIYIESDAAAIHDNLVGAMRYAISRYTNDPHFFRWHGRPVIFVWDPLGEGRTLATWTAVRRQVDPKHHIIWSAEGTDMSLLDVFDGIHLFSAGDWGLQEGDMSSVDRSFEARVAGYNAAHHTTRIWAAGVEPGYDDTRVPGRTQTHRIPRDNGTTYRTSWTAALSSRPTWITISTFNEWFEGAMIEPSVTYGNLYLKLTKRYARQWRHRP